MQLDTVKTLSEIFNNTVIAVGLILGGIWAYYKYIKGRLFADRFNLRITKLAVKEIENFKIATIETCIENIGTTQIQPRKFILITRGISTTSDLSEEQIYESENLLEDEYISPGSWYLEPQQTDSYSLAVPIPKQYILLRISLILTFNNGATGTRHYTIYTDENKITASDNKILHQ